MKRGILGGTFDPIHLGHLLIAERVRQTLGLDEVIFVPAGDPWLKRHRFISEVHHRLTMVSLAISGSPFFGLSDIETTRPGPSYTVETITEFRKSGGELYFILGSDNLLSLPMWHRPLDLINLCTLVVVPRFGGCAVDMSALEERLPGISAKTTLLERPLIDVSSTEIRRRAAAGSPIDHLVSKKVEDYIKANGLYTRYPGS